VAEAKNKGEELKKKLSFEFENGWEVISEKEKKKVFDFSEGYKKFLDDAKTERESVKAGIVIAEKHGFKNIDEYIKNGKKLSFGDKVYRINKDKNLILIVIGEEKLESGMNLTGAHIDCPRLDLKQNPIYEDTEMVFLKTHYYGGIKKYQWVTIPLALHGVIITAEGKKIEIAVGEKENDPIFYINDLLPHLAQEQMQKKMSEGITGEQLNVLIGSIPIKDAKAKDKVKLAVLEYLNKEYGMKEADFLTAEIEVVPAGRARDLGFDRSMVAAYGHDDRICAYTELEAIIEIEKPKKTCMCILVDKEEIGSVGSTGAKSMFFENTVAEVINLTEDVYSDLKLRRALENSKMLSADVNCAVDPNFEGVTEKRNASYLSKGIVVTKYTGSRGKSGASDANAEFLGQVRKILDDGKVVWQIGELGKVDFGGGGTIAQYMANYNMEVVDCGVPILSMHAPCEVASKVDIYMTYRAYLEFFKNMN
jgi:aspartyl aminopeptidase